MKVVINGAGAAGTAIAKLISGQDINSSLISPVGDVVICDSKGAISSKRNDLNATKQELLQFTNKEDNSGTLTKVIEGANAFIGVSKGNIISAIDVERMAPDPIILAMANPTPEIMPHEALKGGAAIVGTGRSDFPNQVNNVLVFPGIFRGALDARSPIISEDMKIAAALALSAAVDNVSDTMILPHPLDRTVAPAIAKNVRAVAKKNVE